MSDRKLLELAAKAAGIDGDYVENDEWFGTGIIANDEYDCLYCWNPLNDDGEAFRLATDLEMIVDLFGREVRVKTGWSYGSPNFHTENIALDTGDDRKANRIAILCAAAIIGEGME